MDSVFPFFSDASNLEAITPPWLHFEVRGKSTESLGRGTLIDYRLRIRGIGLTWQSRIEEWEPGKRFVDVQTRGPYALWHHTHTFESRDGGTLMRDHVRYQLPGGFLGNRVARGWVRRDLEEIFAYRRRRIDELLG